MPVVHICLMKMPKSSHEVFVHSPYMARRVVNWLHDCVARNQLRRGAYCWVFLASELMSHSCMDVVR
jgi:hypothetical protein